MNGFTTFTQAIPSDDEREKVNTLKMLFFLPSAAFIAQQSAKSTLLLADLLVKLYVHIPDYFGGRARVQCTQFSLHKFG